MLYMSGLSIRKIIMAEYSHYGGIEVLNQLGTGYTHAGYWRMIAKFTKFLFTVTA